MLRLLITNKHFSLDYIQDEECFGSSKCFADLVPNLQASSSRMAAACCADSLNHHLSREDEAEQGPGPLTPHLKPNLNLQGDHKVTDDVTSKNETAQSSGLEMKKQSDTGEIMCKCKKPETQEAGTQTPCHPMAEMQDASTQCSFVEGGTSVDSGINFCHSPVDSSPPNQARRGQCSTTLQQDTYTTSMGEAARGMESPWRKQNPRYNCVINTDTINTFPGNNSDSKVIPQRPINPFLNTLSDNKGKIKGCHFIQEKNELTLLKLTVFCSLCSHERGQKKGNPGEFDEKLL